MLSIRPAAVMLALALGSAACSLTLDYDAVRPTDSTSVSIGSLDEFYRTERGRSLLIPYELASDVDTEITITIEGPDGPLADGLAFVSVVVDSLSTGGTIELTVGAGAAFGSHELVLVATASPNIRSTGQTTVVVSGPPGTRDETFDTTTIPSTGSQLPVAVAVAARAPWTVYVLLSGVDSSSIIALNQDGSAALDFASTGTLTLDFEGQDIAVDSNGRLVVVGAETADGTNSAFVQRYMPSGVPDGSFGAGSGSLTIADATLTSLDVDESGRLWVSGAHSSEACVWTLDSAGSGSEMLCDSDGDTWRDIAVQGGDRAVVVGSSETQGYRVRRYRYQSSTLEVDPSFAMGFAGVIEQAGSRKAQAIAVAEGELGPQGSIAVGGENGDGLLRLWRISEDADQGGDPITFEDSNYAIQDIVSDSLGRFVLATSPCTDPSNEPTCAGLVRWSEGAIDSSFGASGDYRVTEVGLPASVFYAVAIQSDGRIIAVGESQEFGLVQRVWD